MAPNGNTRANERLRRLSLQLLGANCPCDTPQIPHAVAASATEIAARLMANESGGTQVRVVLSHLYVSHPFARLRSVTCMGRSYPFQRGALRFSARTGWWRARNRRPQRLG